MSEEEREKYMRDLWSDVLKWEAIQMERELSQIETIIAISKCSEFDCKVNLGWPDPSLEEI
jgi:hypothetical protein